MDATTGSSPAWRSAITSVLFLNDDPALLLRDRVPREVEPVQDRRLVEELPHGRVDVLAAQRIVLVKLARLEADDPAAGIRQWEHQPAGK